MVINFILSSINDHHFLKRVQEFLDHGYEVVVYGFRRKDLPLPKTSFPIIEVGEIACGNYFDRLALFYRQIKQIAKESSDGIFFYSSLDIALFATHIIKSPYLYEICDLTELTISNPILRNILIWQNRRIIHKSLKTIITSEGFAEFYKSIDINKFALIPNRVSPYCSLPLPKNRKFDIFNINIGFVGIIRFDTVYNFIRVASECSNVTMHLFGIYANGDSVSNEIKRVVEKHDNIIFHGPFQNPIDLPRIYQQLDMVLCTYPPTPGVIYAEPNKLYEALYFRCPIIVSKDTFLGKKVARMNFGYVIDATNADSISKFLASIDIDEYYSKVDACTSIPLENCININNAFFEELKQI